MGKRESKIETERLRLQVNVHRTKEFYETAWAEYETYLLEGPSRARWRINRDREHICYLSGRLARETEALETFNRKHPPPEA